MGVGVVTFLVTMAALPAAAQDFPNRPVTIVVPFAAGGPTDVIARILAQDMTQTLGQTVLVENKADLMRKLGKKQLILQLHHGLTALPDSLAAYQLELSEDGHEIVYTYDTQREHNDITTLFKDLSMAGITFKDLQTHQSSLEDIFVKLVRSPS